MDLAAALGDHRRYERQIERLHTRYLFTRHLYQLQQNGVPLASLIFDGSRLARVLARAVASGDYQWQPAQLRRIVTSGKTRTVFALQLTDTIVHGVVAEILQEAAAPFLSPHLFSYRKTLSSWSAVSAFAAYVRSHRRLRPDPRTRGLYVFRRDVAAYGDSVPIDPRSPIWRIVREVLEQMTGTPLRERDWTVIEAVIRPTALTEQGRLFVPYRGIPSGQAIAGVLLNLYLMACDRDLDATHGAFYARYSDDILFAHPEPDVAREAAARLERRLAELELVTSREKSQDLYLTKAGRASAEWPETRGTTCVPFLGCHVAADGTTALNQAKVRSLLRDLERRARRTATALATTDRDHTGRLVCAALNEALDPRNHVVQHPSAVLLRRVVTERPQLRQLDYWIARTVLKVVTGDAAVRAFRRVSYRAVRREWGLRSLLYARNRWRAGTISR